MFWTLPQSANRPSLQVDGASVDPYILPAENHVHSHNPSRKSEKSKDRWKLFSSGPHPLQSGSDKKSFHLSFDDLDEDKSMINSHPDGSLVMSLPVPDQSSQYLSVTLTC